MRAVLTPQLLRFLIAEGYQFCLLKALDAKSKGKNPYLMLTPATVNDPEALLSEKCDTFFAIRAEPVLLAEGYTHMPVLVNISRQAMHKYKSSGFSN